MADIPILRHLTLHSAQVKFLEEIARRGGEMRFTWANAREDVQGMVADLLQKTLVRYVEHVTSSDQVSGPTFLVLTDVGRRAVAQAEEAQKRQATVESRAPEIKVTG